MGRKRAPDLGAVQHSRMGPNAATRTTGRATPVWQWLLLVVLTAVAAAVLGVFALVDVIDGNGGEAGQTPWMNEVTSDGALTWTVFLAGPFLLGVTAAIIVRHLRMPFVGWLVAGTLTVVGYLYALVVLGTGLGPW